jgi:hypothetical protein
MRGAEERAEPRAGVDRAAPLVGEAQAVELRERLEEVLGEDPRGGRPLVVAGPDVPAVVVDRVVAAPQDPVVRGHPVVVELVGQVADPLPVPPADAAELARRQRLGDQDVVVHRHGVQPDPADQAAERVRAQRGLAGGDRRVRGRQGQPGPVAPDAEHRGLLEDPYPG